MRFFTVARVTLAVAVAIATFRLIAPAWLEVLDLRLLDIRQVVRGPLRPGADVIIVGIDERSLDEIGRWPWPRSRLATLIERLSADGPSVIGFDMVFGQPDLTVDLLALRAAVAKDPMRPVGDVLEGVSLDQDASLAAALRASERTILGYYVDLSGATAPDLVAAAAHVPELSVRATGGVRVEHVPGLATATQVHVPIAVLAGASAGAGHFNFVPDPDGIYRRLPVAIRVADRLVPALGLEMIRRHLGSPSATLDLGPEGVTAVRLGPLALPVDARGHLWINYLGPPHTFPYVSAGDVIAGRVPAGTFATKLVLVGFTAAGFDEIATPFSAVQAGVELQATVIDDMLHGHVLHRPWWLVPGEVVVILLCGVVLALALRQRRAVAGVSAAVALALFYVWGTQRLFTGAGLALGAVYPLSAIAACTLAGSVFRAVVEEREKRRIRDAFRHYLNPEVTDLLASDPTRLRLGGERREVTVFFSDIQGFTSISEQLEAGALGELLNEYLGTMTDVVFRHEGLLDKYVGDALMAIWGAPIEVTDHARRSCSAALDMLDALAHLRTGWRTLGLPLIDIRIGINSGLAAVGNFGSTQRFSYTAVGDTVNLASRIEGLSKEYGTRILVSESTRKAAGDDFVYREIDWVRVRGRTQPLAIYELLGRRAADRAAALLRRAAVYESALATYRRQAWDETIASLEGLAAEDPDDRPVATFLARCRRLRATPPGPAWDAIFDGGSPG